MIFILLLIADLSRSSVVASKAKVLPKETIDYVITLRNTGDESPQFVYVSNHLSNSALFVSSAGWQYEPADSN